MTQDTKIIIGISIYVVVALSLIVVPCILHAYPALTIIGILMLCAIPMVGMSAG